MVERYDQQQEIRGGSNEEVVRLLLDVGADIHTCDDGPAAGVSPRRDRIGSPNTRHSLRIRVGPRRGPVQQQTRKLHVTRLALPT